MNTYLLLQHDFWTNFRKESFHLTNGNCIISAIPRLYFILFDALNRNSEPFVVDNFISAALYLKLGYIYSFWNEKYAFFTLKKITLLS